jgi:hypothetical protein
MTSVLLVLASIFLLWNLYNTIKNKPELFSLKNINNSFFTMGMLAIILIILIVLVVIILKR